MTKWQRDKQRILWLLDLAADCDRCLRQNDIAKHLLITQQRVSLLIREMQYLDRSITRTHEEGYRICKK